MLESHNVPLRLTMDTGLPLHRIREIHTFLARLKAIEPEIHRASALSPFPAAPQDNPHPPPNPWTTLLADLHTLYMEETADAELLVSNYIDWLYDSLAEQRREKAIGRGLFLSTIHGAKGLEFDHVFILDGDWRFSPALTREEDERRLLYVGMTRARKTLCLMEMGNQPNPFIADLKGDWIMQRNAPPDDTAGGAAINYNYITLSLPELHLGHVGRFHPDHPIHRHLSGLNAGDTLCVKDIPAGVLLETMDGKCVAKLSRKGNARWSGRAKTICEARIIGMVRWCADDSQEELRP